MNYELALKLREAGFPQDKMGFHYALTKRGLQYRWHLTKKQRFQMVLVGIDLAKAPTLSELIEACGDDFGALKRLRKNIWNAEPSVFLGFDTMAPYLHQSTPEEAVANLYLAIHKK